MIPSIESHRTKYNQSYRFCTYFAYIIPIQGLKTFTYPQIPFTCRDILFGNIYDTFSGEDNLSKAVFLEMLCQYIRDHKLQNLRTVVVKDLIGTYEL